MVFGCQKDLEVPVTVQLIALLKNFNTQKHYIFVVLIHGQPDTDDLCQTPETTERFLVEEPRQQYALKSQHDFADKVELPEFINIPMDQGTESKPEDLGELATEDIPRKTTASISSEKIDRGRASVRRKPIQVSFHHQLDKDVL